MVILLGTHFLFNEELGSRLRGEGYTVHPYNSLDDLISRYDRENYIIELVIIDLQHKNSGTFEAISFVKSMKTPIIAIGEHKKTVDLQIARDLDVERVIINSQASMNIEKYVNELLNY